MGDDLAAQIGNRPDGAVLVYCYAAEVARAGYRSVNDGYAVALARYGRRRPRATDIGEVRAQIVRRARTAANLHPLHLRAAARKALLQQA